MWTIKKLLLTRRWHRNVHFSSIASLSFSALYSSVCLFHSKLLQPLQDRVCPASAIIKCPRSGCQSQIRSEVYSTPACLGLVNVFAPPIPALTGWDMSLVPPIGHVGRAHWNPLTSMSLAGTRSICQLCEKEATCDNPAPYTRKHSDAGGSYTLVLYEQTVY